MSDTIISLKFRPEMPKWVSEPTNPVFLDVSSKDRKKVGKRKAKSLSENIIKKQNTYTTVLLSE